MDRLFKLLWYKISLYEDGDADKRDLAYDEKQQLAVEHIEEKPADNTSRVSQEICLIHGLEF